VQTGYLSDLHFEIATQCKIFVLFERSGGDKKQNHGLVAFADLLEPQLFLKKFEKSGYKTEP